MKPSLELQQIVSALGIDPFRYLAWQEKELAEKRMAPSLKEQESSTRLYDLVV